MNVIGHYRESMQDVLAQDLGIVVEGVCHDVR